MIKILCPTDFSNNSKFAIEYAINIANELDAKLFFMSSYQIPRPTGGFRSIDEVVKENVIEDFKDFLMDLTDLIKSSHDYELITKQGNTTDGIAEVAHEKSIDLIVLGTMGSAGISKLLLGSVTKKLFETSKTPVLAIPSIVKENMTGNKMLLCLDKKGIEKLKSIKLLESLKIGLNVEMDVLHVNTSNEKIELNDNSGLLSNITSSIIEIDGNDSVKEIKKYVDGHDIGILVMVGRKHSFWERLFFESHTTAELFASNVPILLLPE